MVCIAGDRGLRPFSGIGLLARRRCEKFCGGDFEDGGIGSAFAVSRYMMITLLNL